VPWCEDCGKFYTPSTLTPEGDCPAGHHVAGPADPIAQSTAPPREEDQGSRVPWHFWLLLAAVVIYLGWRLVQGIQWVLG
jgi:hypothetical protein